MKRRNNRWGDSSQIWHIHLGSLFLGLKVSKYGQLEGVNARLAPDE